ncbi:MAG: glutamyl-tRNA reductase [Gammaproteobacteria bacterium]|nr:glutamyl-tRNA reductase [Gammaproteobacteria bacterium]
MFIACGINHQTAPIHFREKLSVPTTSQKPALEYLMATPNIQEITLLSTCNRTELYCQTTEPETLMETMASLCHVTSTDLHPHWYMHTDHQGIKHALRVASGLDSMMLGEPQILGQFKQAYQHACATGTAKSSLKQIFSYVFRASKRIRNLSGIGNTPVSIAYAATQRILQSIPQLDGVKIFVIGSGDMAQLVTKYLFDAGSRQFFVTSRTEAHAQKLASLYQGQVVPITSLEQTLPQVDIVITASTCPIPFITPEFLTPLLRNRTTPLFLLDLAVPRNITETVGTLPHVTLCNIDELQTQCQVGQLERREAAVHAEQLVLQELDKFIRWSEVQHTKHLISHYRNTMHTLSQQELSRAVQQIALGESIHEVLEELTHRLFKKLTHLPTRSLRQAALEGCTELLDLAQLLYTKAHHDPHN